MRKRLKRGVIIMGAVFLTFAGISYAAGPDKDVVVHSAMTRAHKGAAQKGHYSMEHGRQGHHRWKDTLSKVQGEKMEAMHLSLKRDIAPLKAELEFRSVELKNLATTKNPDMAAIKAKIKVISSLKGNILTKRYSHIVEMRKVLTPSQRQSFDLDFLSGVEHWQGHGGH